MIDQTAATLALRNRALSLVVAVTDPFSRAGPATYTDVGGTLQTAPADWKRNAHYVNGILQPVLLEAAATNLLKNSEQVDQSTWTKLNASVTQNATTAPDGTLTADKLVEDATASAPHLVSCTGLGTGTNSASIFAKKGERTILQLGTNNNSLLARFDLNAGTILAGAGRITAFVNGWYRCEYPNYVTGGAQGIFYQMCDASGLNSYNGDGVSGLYLWGGQFEAGALSTSYIKTPGAVSVARAPDLQTGANLAATTTGYTRGGNGSFLTEGFADGMEFVPAGFSDVTPKVIESVSAGAIVTTTAPTVQTAVAGRSLSVGFPAIQGFDNRKVKRIEGRPYTEEEFVPGGHSLMGTTFGYNNEDGLYLIKYYGLEGKGVAGIRKWCDALKALFAPGTNLVAGSNTVRVRTDVSVKSGQILPQGNGWAVCTVTVPWWALSNNAVAA